MPLETPHLNTVKKPGAIICTTFVPDCTANRIVCIAKVPETQTISGMAGSDMLLQFQNIVKKRSFVPECAANFISEMYTIYRQFKVGLQDACEHLKFELKQTGLIFYTGLSKNFIVYIRNSLIIFFNTYINNKSRILYYTNSIYAYNQSRSKVHWRSWLFNIFALLYVIIFYNYIIVFLCEAV